MGFFTNVIMIEASNNPGVLHAVPTRGQIVWKNLLFVKSLTQVSSKFDTFITVGVPRVAVESRFPELKKYQGQDSAVQAPMSALRDIDIRGADFSKDLYQWLINGPVIATCGKATLNLATIYQQGFYAHNNLANTPDFILTADSLPGKTLQQKMTELGIKSPLGANTLGFLECFGYSLRGKENPSKIKVLGDEWAGAHENFSFFEE